ncbi:MAG TPA: TOBE domain-containing protein [Alphaproteobacteria bacterium]|nr:TOBE domain-containing protein [Alphaproteobacteria bacterium]
MLGTRVRARRRGRVEGERLACIRAENLRLIAAGGIVATVESAAFHGDGTRLKIRPAAAPATELHLTVRDAPVRPGDQVRVSVDDAWIIPDG